MKKFIFSVLFALVFSFSGFSQDISGINTDELVATIASAFNQVIKEDPSNPIKTVVADKAGKTLILSMNGDDDIMELFDKNPLTAKTLFMEEMLKDDDTMKELFEVLGKCGYGMSFMMTHKNKTKEIKFTAEDLLKVSK